MGLSGATVPFYVFGKDRLSLFSVLYSDKRLPLVITNVQAWSPTQLYSQMNPIIACPAVKTEGIDPVTANPPVITTSFEPQ